MIRRLLKETDIRGVHFCTLKLEKSIQRILETLEWIPQSTSVIQNKLISVRFIGWQLTYLSNSLLLAGNVVNRSDSSYHAYKRHNNRNDRSGETSRQ
jgi:hypothetical protein